MNEATPAQRRSSFTVDLTVVDVPCPAEQAHAYRVAWSIVMDLLRRVNEQAEGEYAVSR